MHAWGNMLESFKAHLVKVVVGQEPEAEGAPIDGCDRGGLRGWHIQRAHSDPVHQVLAPHALPVDVRGEVVGLWRHPCMQAAML